MLNYQHNFLFQPRRGIPLELVRTAKPFLLVDCGAPLAPTSYARLVAPRPSWGYAPMNHSFTNLRNQNGQYNSLEYVDSKR